MPFVNDVSVAPLTRFAVPAAALGLLVGLNAPAYAAPAPAQAEEPVEVQAAVTAPEMPLARLQGPADLVSAKVAAADGKVSAATILPATCAPSTSPARQGLTAESARVLDCTSQAFPAIPTYLGIGYRSANRASDHPSGRAVDVMIDKWETEDGKAQGWRVANFVAANSKQWNVKYVIWDAQIYSPQSGTWRPYRHPSGATDPNNAHLNHVHVSTKN